MYNPCREVGPMKSQIAVLFVLCALAARAPAFDGYPRVTTVEPESGKVADSVSAKGENLDKANIGELYLTDGAKDWKVQISEQTSTEIKFKVPKTEPGRYHLMILTANKKSMVEQPVVFTVE
jgi:hypothetical protein